MTAQVADERVSEQEFLARERAAETKHELWDGEVFAMAGASLAHNLVVGNLVTALNVGLRDPECVVLPSDMKVRVPAASGFAYPDVTVVCGTVRFAGDVRDVVENPTLLVEVLSPTTERFDRGRKFEGYRRLPSLREYLLVSPAARHVERYRRVGEGRWELSDHRAGSFRLDAVDLDLRVGDVYRKVPLEDEAGS